MNKVFTILYVGFFIIAFLLRFLIRNRTLKTIRTRGQATGLWTSRFIFITYLILFFGSLAEYFLTGREINPALSLSGLGLYILGILGRQWSWRSLGPLWSVDIRAEKGQRIVREGPYRWIRHPNSLSNLMEMAGFLLIPNAFYTMILFIMSYVPVIIVRVVLEERLMLQVLGRTYLNYAGETGMFFPKIHKKEKTP